MCANQTVMTICQPIKLKLIQWNMHSFNANKINLLLFVSDYQPDLIFLSETWLSPQHIMNIPGYFNIRKDRQDGYGGLAVAIKHGISVDNLDLNLNWLPVEIQIIAVKVKKLTILSMYCPPNSKITSHMWFQILNKVEPPYIILGDLNANNVLWGSGKNNPNGKILASVLRQTDLVLLNDGSPTRISNPLQNKSAVDLTLCSPCMALDMDWRVITDTGTSDHFPIICTINQGCIDNRIEGRIRRKFSKANWSNYAEMINKELEQDFTEKDYSYLVKSINKAANNTIPYSSTVSQNIKYKNMWWDEECRIALQNRRDGIKLFLRESNMENYIGAKKVIAETQRVLKKKKENFFSLLLCQS